VFQLIERDWRSKEYYLTFKGIKTSELLSSVEKIANLSIATMDDADTKLIVNLNRHENWLKTLIRDEMRHAVKELKK
jgi:hypothetical protein